MIFAARGALVLAAVMLMDWLWTQYTLAVSSRSAHRAACISVGLYLLGAFVTIEYVQDWRLIPFALVGAYAGTWIGARKDD